MKDNWDDGNYMEWADQERLVRQDIEEINRSLRRRKAENYREVEHGRNNIAGQTEPRSDRD
ncbi:MAG: hypothetical protein H2212_07135 [Ruminococcus sp.]|nr:hypothetical protein [Ruminococcus sp.]